MITAFLALALVAAPVVNEADCDKDADGYCTSRSVYVDLDRHRAEPHFALNVALGEIVSVRLPAAMRLPRCSETDPQANICGIRWANKALFTVRQDGQVVSIEPQVPADLRLPAGTSVETALQGERGSLRIQSQDGRIITIALRIRWASLAVGTLVFKSEKLEDEERRFSERLEAHTKALKDDLEAGWTKVNAEAKRRTQLGIAHALLTEHRCNEWRWTDMQDLLWVQANSICQIGSSLYVTFTIENRARLDTFKVDAIRMLSDDGEEDIDLGTTHFIFHRIGSDEGEGTPTATPSEQIALKYGDRIKGLVVAEPGRPVSQVVLEVKELGGKARVVRVGGVEF